MKKLNSFVLAALVLGGCFLPGKADGAVTSSTVQGTILKLQESVADETLFDELDEGPGTASVQTGTDFSLTHLQLSGETHLLDAAEVTMEVSALEASPGLPYEDRPSPGHNYAVLVESRVQDALTFKSTTNKDHGPVVITFIFYAEGRVESTPTAYETEGHTFIDYLVSIDGEIEYLNVLDSFDEPPPLQKRENCTKIGNINRFGLTVQYNADLYCSANVSNYDGGNVSADGQLSLVAIKVSGLRLGVDYTVTSLSGRDYSGLIKAGQSPLLNSKKNYFSGLLHYTKGDPIDYLDRIDAYLRQGGDVAPEAPRARGAGEPPGEVYDFTLTLRSGPEKFKAKGTCDVDGIAHFGTATEKVFTRKDGSQFTVSAILTETEESAFYTVTSTDVAPPQAQRTIVAELAAYSREKKAPDELKVPLDLLGTYTVALPALDPTAQGLPIESYPSGAGVGSLTIGNGGVAQFVGRLADGTPLMSEGIITVSNEVILYSPLYGGKGIFAARLKVRDTAGVSDIDATEVFWTRPAISGANYPDGWPTGIGAGFVACQYQRTPGVSILPGLAAEDTDGNSLLTLTRGGLAAPAARALNISPKNKVRVIDANADGLKVELNAKTGLLSGNFRHPSGGKTKLSGAVLQKQGRALGHFPGPTEAGALELAGAE